MNNDRSMFEAVLANVGEVKLLRHLKIELNGSALPASFQCIEYVKIYFWSVKCTVSFVDTILDAQMIQHIL
ncbi:hypothetical protein D3C73_1337040 [compost metagenome]